MLLTPIERVSWVLPTGCQVPPCGHFSPTFAVIAVIVNLLWQVTEMSDRKDMALHFRKTIQVRFIVGFFRVIRSKARIQVAPWIR